MTTCTTNEHADAMPAREAEPSASRRVAVSFSRLLALKTRVATEL